MSAPEIVRPLNIRGARVVVTGGSGFIGRAVCKLLIARGASVLNYDLMPWQSSDPCPRTVVGDIEDCEILQSVCETFNPEIFIHLAAFASINATSRDDYSSIWRGTAIAAKAFAESQTPRRFVNISTQLVIRPGPQPKDLRAYAPYTPYGEAKAEAEQIIEKMGRPYIAVHVRPTNIWGPHHPSYAESIMRYLEKGWYLHPSTSRPIERTYGYVENCAAQIVSIAFAENLLDNEIFYSGDKVMDSGFFLDELSIALRGKPARRLPIALLRGAGKAGTVIQSMGLPCPLDNERVMRMTTDYRVPLEKTQSVMSFSAVPFDEAIRRTAAWYRAGVKHDQRA